MNLDQPPTTSSKYDSNVERNVYCNQYRLGVLCPFHDLNALGVMLLKPGMERRRSLCTKMWLEFLDRFELKTVSSREQGSSSTSPTGRY